MIGRETKSYRLDRLNRPRLFSFITQCFSGQGDHYGLKRYPSTQITRDIVYGRQKPTVSNSFRIRREIAREADEDNSGGDFYAPFWADARAHVFGDGNLHSMIDVRLESNVRRRNLYPRLRDGFLLWWNKRRRWTNEPFHPGRSIKAHFPFPGLNAEVKVDSILSVRDGLDVERAVYPYFAPEPELSEEAARLGLWLLCQALPLVPPDEFRILDVIRGRTFSLDRYPLLGNEEAVFRGLYAQLLDKHKKLKTEYH